MRRKDSRSARTPELDDSKFGDVTEVRGSGPRLDLLLLPDLVYDVPLRDTRAAGASPETPFDLLQIALDKSPDGILIIAPPSNKVPPRPIYANETFLRMTGMDRDDVVGRDLQIFRVGESDRAVRDSLEHPLCQRRAFEGEAAAYRKNGSRYSVELMLVPIRDGNDPESVMHWIAYVKDVSDRKKELAALERQALHDVLTGLPNRSLLLDRLEQAILNAKRSRSSFALMIMDLDGFKDVNDTLGHQAGDVLLQQVARRLRSSVGDEGTIARLGGDEFALVLAGLEDGDTALRPARELLRELEPPFTIETERVDVGASIGIAVFPAHGEDASTLMRHADAAMYHAKRTGSGAALFSRKMLEGLQVGLTLGAELREGIEAGQLRLYYQPKVHLRTGLVTRVEALVRWMHPTRGLLLPDQFVPLAERTGLIRPLTEWVLDEALRQCAEWQSSGLPLHIAVNLSTRMLQDHGLPQSVASRLERFKLPPHVLKLEITESSIMADPPQVLAILSLLQTLGVRLSLDDFGTGYSSLMHLRQLPVDEIKIDKAFVMGMATSAGDQAIVRATIDLAHNLGRQVVAEGVDDERVCRVLAGLGCDFAQGYTFSRPLPAAAFQRWLKETEWGFQPWKRIVGDHLKGAKE